MKLTYDDLMKYMETPEHPMEPISQTVTDRILARTMDKVAEQPANMKHRNFKLFRNLVASVLTVAVLSGSAFAAYEYGWFGLDKLLGAEGTDTEEHIVSFQPQEPVPAEVTTGAFKVDDELVTESLQEQLDIAAVGAAHRDHDHTAIDWSDRYPVSENNVVELTDYRISLDSLMADPFIINAVVRLEPLTDFGREQLGTDGGWGEGLIHMTCNNANNPLLGGKNIQLLACDGEAAFYLLSCVGTENKIGDTIYFQALSIPTKSGYESADLFNVELTDMVEEVKQFETASGETVMITPMSLKITGDFSWWTSGRPEIVIKLTDGTEFALYSTKEWYVPDTFGTYGDISVAGSGDDTGREFDSYYAWVFSKILELEQVMSVTIDGTEYVME